MPSVQETVKRIICEEVKFQILFLNWILSITRLLSDRFVFSKLFFSLIVVSNLLAEKYSVGKNQKWH